MNCYEVVHGGVRVVSSCYEAAIISRSLLLLDLSLRMTYPATNQLRAVTDARARICRNGAVHWDQ